MAETKSFASLSSGLLARKGGAKPAMRPQGFGSFGGSLEDLGWNDMGAPEHYEHVPTPIDALTPSPGGRASAPQPQVEEIAPVVVLHPAPLEAAPEAVEPEEAVEAAPEPESQSAHEPEPHSEPAPEPEPEPVHEVQAIEPPLVVEQQRALSRRFPASAPAEVVRLPRHRAMPARAKAAFTLRLDPERHLKLRLACALDGRSAQLLVTEALDAYLAAQPGVEALAERVPAAGKSGR